jgi:hypothetical protein
MSSEMWAMQMLRKYQLSVDFCIDMIEDPWCIEYRWGVEYEFKTFEETLAHVVKIMDERYK